MQGETVRPVMVVAALFVSGCPTQVDREANRMVTNTDAELNSQADRPRSLQDIRREGNHLVGEPSPYLEQHAHNPVDWYPWGEPALARAKRENKPIFLSIGYSTCHWCHVMEEESFTDDEVADFLNRHFVSIKVDREQRPDIDALYIAAVSKLGGSTGWPLTVFLTPQLQPFFGGTYFPKHSGRGRPGFLDVLSQVEEMWRDDPTSVINKGQAVLRQVEQQAKVAHQQGRKADETLVRAALAQLARARDPQWGGFGGRQKFPNAPLLLAELRHYQMFADKDARDHLILTLDQLASGGIRDHLQGSFHRYAVDRRWHVPHFEKMLYDNAQLAGIFVDAGRTFNRADYTKVGRQILDDLIAHWQRPDGGFVVGFDADDAGGEGTYYTWTPGELAAVLDPPQARLVEAVYGVTERGSPGLHGRSVLRRGNVGQAARDMDQFFKRRKRRPYGRLL